MNTSYSDIDDLEGLSDWSLRGQMLHESEEDEPLPTRGRHRFEEEREEDSLDDKEDEEPDVGHEGYLMSGGLALDDPVLQNRRAFEHLQTGGYAHAAAEVALSAEPSRLFVDNEDADPHYFDRKYFDETHEALKSNAPLALQGYLAGLDDKLLVGEDLDPREWRILQTYRRYGVMVHEKCIESGNYRADGNATLDNFVAAQGRYRANIEGIDWTHPEVRLAWPMVHPLQPSPQQTVHVEPELDVEDLPYGQDDEEHPEPEFDNQGQ